MKRTVVSLACSLPNQSFSAIKLIYYAEDDKDDAELFVSAIQEITDDTEIILSTNGSELFGNLNGKVPPIPQFLFLDLNMPLKSGHECLIEIKANTFYNSMRVIVLSTSCTSHDIDRTFVSGADYYICKPSRYDQYRAAIKKVLNASYTRKPSREEFVIK